MPLTLRHVVSTGAAAALALALAVAPAFGAGAATARASAGTAAGTPVSLAILVPLTVRPTASGLIDATTLAADTAPFGVLTRQLDAVIDTPAVIGLDPMIVASVRVLGSSAPASAISWLTRLQGASNETFALAYADADVASLARVDSLALKDPLGFDFAIDTGHFGPALTASPTPIAGESASPTPTGEPGGGTSGSSPPLPTTTQEVLDWSYGLSNIAWPADDTVVAGDLDDLSDAGYKQVVLSSSNLSSTDSGLVDLNGIQGIVADAGITSLVRDAVYAGVDSVQQDALTRLNSALVGLEAVSPGRTVVAALDRRWPVESLNVAALYADLLGQSSVTAVGLSSVLAGAHPDAQVTDEAGDASRVAQLRSIVDAVNQENAFATAAVDPQLVLEPRRLELLSLLAVSWLRGADDWTVQADTFLSDSVTLRSSVRIVSGSNLFVGAGQTNIPVTVSNALKVPVTVYVNVSSPSSVLQVQKHDVALTIEPGSSNKAAIPVEALTNGKVTTTVTIVSAQRVPLGFPDYVDVDLQPGWESIGTTIIVILLVLIFGGGITRNLLKRRKAKMAAAGTAPAGTAAAGTAPADDDAPAEAARD